MLQGQIPLAVLIFIVVVSATLIWREMRGRHRARLNAAMTDLDDDPFANPGRRGSNLPGELRPLSPAQRTSFAAQWRNVKSRFVDEPQAAAVHADRLAVTLLLARGLPIEDGEQAQIDLSSSAGALLARHFREARTLAKRDRARPATLEEMRQAMLHYQVLFDDLARQEGGGESSGSAPQNDGRSARSPREGLHLVVNK